MGFPEADPAVSLHCQGILFDMDGILISSIEAAERAWSKWAAMKRVDRDLVLSVMHGCQAVETVAKTCPDCDAEAEAKVIERLEMEDTEGLKVLAGVPELLSTLPAERWTVVTSPTRELVRVRLEAGGIPVPDRMVTAELVKNGKPDPEPFLVGARLLGFQPEECVVFEDSVSGVKAGRAAGCIVVGTTFTHPLEMLDAADYVIEDLSGLTVETSDAGMVLRFNSLK
jgi:sugar-phosphatase